MPCLPIILINFFMAYISQLFHNGKIKIKIRTIADKFVQVYTNSLKLTHYSRVWNKRSPLNKHSPLENLAKRISVAPFLPYTIKSGIRP